MRWPHQVYGFEETVRRLIAGETKICVTSPTGGGKTTIIGDLIEWALEHGYAVVVYTNRKLLISQLERVLAKRGFTFGVRAAGYADNRQLDVQISSIPTESSRVFKTEQWNVHGHGRKTLAIIDEAHLNASFAAQRLLCRHLDHGGAYVGFTATPIDLAHLYTSLVVAGTMSELRACGALVKCYHYGPDEPDMKGFQQNVKTGEFKEGDLRKAIMHKQIFARVLDYYRKLNPEQKPCLLFGPGVAESIWFAEQFTAAGIRAAHIDSKGIWIDGEYKQETDREWLLDYFRQGDVKVLCNRFVMREGLDIREIAHVIAATVMGSLRTLLQSVGRGLRACDGKDSLIFQDHGGHWHRHGSVNADREWSLTQTEAGIREARMESMRSKQQDEPIHCAKCGMIRASGAKCPGCGFESTKKSRLVIQASGKLVEHEGDIYKPQETKSEPNTLELWMGMFWRARRSKNRMNFKQALGLFFREYHYWPSRDLPFMPSRPTDMMLPVADVPFQRLNGWCEGCHRCLCKCGAEAPDEGLFAEAV